MVHLVTLSPCHPQGGILSVALSRSFVSLRPWSPRRGKKLRRWALPTTASCGARTFLPPVTRRDLDGPEGFPEDDRPAGLRTFPIIAIRRAPAPMARYVLCPWGSDG